MLALLKLNDLAVHEIDGWNQHVCLECAGAEAPAYNLDVGRPFRAVGTPGLKRRPTIGPTR